MAIATSKEDVGCKVIVKSLQDNQLFYNIVFYVRKIIFFVKFFMRFYTPFKLIILISS